MCIRDSFDIELADDMKMVAYKSENKITNTGDNAWTKEGGLVSVWMLGCFNPTPTTTVFIPYKENAEGVIVNDAVSYTHLRAHETGRNLVCRLLLEKKKYHFAE